LILYCATTNPGKLREFRLLAQGVEIQALDRLREIPPPEENGVTFEENAQQKALYYARFTSSWLFAEDSGLEVDALGGAPGIYSARFSGFGATDDANNALLIERMRGVENRAARYVCVTALVHDSHLVQTFRGIVEGEIVDSPRGSNGFGYDPLFFYPPFGKTFGEASAEAKMRVSHRGRAVSAMLDYLRSLRSE
jgi:XTP/dITP diphosphohydrolase